MVFYPGYLKKIRLLILVVAFVSCISFACASSIKLIEPNMQKLGDSFEVTESNNASLKELAINPSWNLSGNSTSDKIIKANLSETDGYPVANVDGFNEQFSGVVLSQRIDELQSQLETAQKKIDELTLNMEKQEKINDDLKTSNDNLRISNDQMREEISKIEQKLSNYLEDKSISSVVKVGSAVNEVQGSNTTADDISGVGKALK